jgi:NAD(P)-dependent dehydrogenase (short-subunit alcohol dehydrogenase family)
MIHTVSGPSYSAAKHAVTSMSDTLNAEEGIHGIRSICISPGEVATPILETRPKPPSAADRALMLQPEDVAAAALFCASLPARACIKQLVIAPTDDNAFRAQARAIKAMPPRTRLTRPMLRLAKRLLYRDKVLEHLGATARHVSARPAIHRGFSPACGR